MSGQTSEGTESLLTEDPFPFTAARLSYDQKPTLEADENTGAFKYIFPIVTPPGRNGMEPDLQLIYDSSLNKNDYLGLNWTTNITYIERINRTGVENLFTDDYFSSSLDGELKATSTQAGASMASQGGEASSLPTLMEGTDLSSTSSMQELLEGQSATDRANIKSTEIVKVFPMTEYEDAAYGLRVEVESISKIDNGIQIFARAWKGKEQLGFGKDGSVEIERFRIFNPPVMVPDGTKREVWSDGQQAFVERDNFKEDPVAAIRQTLAHTISIVGKEGTAIVPGKRGNTTSTFYPDAHPESTTVDGVMHWSTDPSTWNDAHDATAATSVNDSTPDENYIQSRKISSNNFSIVRAVNFFNTSAISATDDVTSATISVYPTTIINDGGV